MLHGEADNIAKRALDFCNETTTVILCRVAASFVERVNRFKIPLYGLGIEIMKCHHRMFGKLHAA